MLAGYLDLDGSTLVLREGEHGKPQLRSRDGKTLDLQFNWSHSGDLALVALARDLEIGVDLEQARSGVHVVELAQRFFAPAEASALIACDEAERENSFLQLWCAKEAVLKALGRGLAFGLERIEFSLSRSAWRPLRFEAQAAEAGDWQVMSLRPSRDCAGALAWRGPPRPLRAWAAA
ncbi:MAG TPA: 4'-phosphopantetheinyl transferase superfamily protein [Rhodanobacteraceae bacterium]|nr:4'-phosphopantetheinyl transferase superfamily protein [Rhodanobacteraceae bacterium]